MTCLIPNCERTDVIARGWCPLHYQRWRRLGDPEYPVADTPEKRFWSRIRKTNDCWHWTGATAGGYGQIVNCKIKTPAHRFSWELHFGQIPDGLFVCHHCDNKLCVNPDHLFLGTASDNMQDMIQKYGHPKQNASYHTRLTETKVRFIRRSNVTSPVLAKLYGVTAEAIQNARRRKTWRHIK